MAKVTSFELISHDTVFFSHNKTTSVGLSAAKTISRTAYEVGAPILCYSIHAKNYKGTHTTPVDRNGVSRVAPVRPPSVASCMCWCGVSPPLISRQSGSSCNARTRRTMTMKRGVTTMARYIHAINYANGS